MCWLLWFCRLMSSMVLLPRTSSCPLPATDSPCHCGLKNDTTSYIQCSRLGLRTIPKFTLSYTYDELDLTENYINRIEDDSFSKLRVRKIYLTGNPISSISKSAFKPLERQLEVLHLEVVISPSGGLDGNGLESPPSSLFCLPRLVDLRLKGFQLETLTLDLCPNLTRLTHLGLVSCGIRSTTTLTTNEQPTIGQSSSSTIRPFHKTIKHLDLSLNPLLKLPPTTFPALISLNLSGNAVNQLFDNSSLQTLKWLDLSKNGVTKWIIPDLQNLHTLTLDKNRIEQIANLPIYPKLRRLSIKHNRLVSIEHIAKKLPELEELLLDGNYLVAFDAYLLDSRLQHLSLRSNKLTVAPSSLPVRLKSLDISDNEICSFSAPVVHSFAKMDRIEVRGNPLFCDCNIRWLQMELMRRKIGDVSCSMPDRSVDVVKLTDLKCFPAVPECVRQAHGSYVRTSEDVPPTAEPERKPNLSISSMELNFVSSYDALGRPRKSIVVNWMVVASNRSRIRGIRVTIVPRLLLLTSNNRTDSFQHYSTMLPSSSRQFVIHGAKPDLIYRICIEALGGAVPSKKCEDIKTINEAAEIISNSSNQPMQLSDARLFVAASVVVGSVLVLLSTLILFITFSRSRKQSMESPLLSRPRNHHHNNNPFRLNSSQSPKHRQLTTPLTLSSGDHHKHTAHQHFGTLTDCGDELANNLQQQQTTSPYFCSGCCCRFEFRSAHQADCKSAADSEQIQQSTTDTRITCLPGRHLYQEIRANLMANSAGCDFV